MFDERYSQGSSVLHRADPRIKIIAAVVLIVLVALSQRWNTPIAGLILGLGLLSWIQLPFGAVIRRMALVNGFVVFLWLVLPLTTPGEPIAQWGVLQLTREGVTLAARITLKANAILLLFFALLTTSHVAALGRGLESLGLPTKLAHLLLFCYRYIFVIHMEFQRLNRAARLRCFRPSTRLHAYRTFGNLLGMTLVKSWDRSQRVSQAMQMRGFQGTLTSLHLLQVRPMDWFLLSALLCCSLGLALLEWC